MSGVVRRGVGHDGDLPAGAAAPRPPRWLLHGGRPLSRWLIRRAIRVHLHHTDRVPERGGVILAANHIGFADGPLLAIFSPRPVHALTKREMFVGRLGRVLNLSGQIPLDRLAVDPAAIKQCLRVLREGGAVGVFPEGTRGAGDLRRIHRGAAYLALVTGAPLVPVTILGTREVGGSSKDLPKRGAHVDLYYGEPLQLPHQPWPRTREQVAQASLLLRRHMLATLDAARHETGHDLPGPLPPGDLDDDPPTGGVHDPGAP